MNRAADLRRSAFLADADALHRRLGDRAGTAWDPNIRSDPAAVDAALLALPVRDGLFLEWGSGLGVIAGLAALRGFDAHGIELRPELVHEARALVARHGIDATFARGTFVPSDYEDDPRVLDEDLLHEGSGPDGYEALGLDLDEFDVVFGFPWPGEEALFLDLFDRHARPGAALLLNLGRDGVVRAR